MYDLFLLAIWSTCTYMWSVHADYVHVCVVKSGADGDEPPPACYTCICVQGHYYSQVYVYEIVDFRVTYVNEIEETCMHLLKYIGLQLNTSSPECLVLAKIN